LATQKQFKIGHKFGFPENGSSLKYNCLISF
jgi:hypothetical protein